MKKLKNYSANLQVLARAHEEDLTNEFIVSGIIDKFFIQFELGWKVLKELLRYEGCRAAQSGSPREIIKEAYRAYDFIDESIWLAMLQARNDLTHIYDGAQASRLVEKILQEYVPAFMELELALQKRYKEVLDSI